MKIQNRAIKNATTRKPVPRSKINTEMLMHYDSPAGVAKLFFPILDGNLGRETFEELSDSDLWELANRLEMAGFVARHTAWKRTEADHRDN
jgi:hypothetical protein